MIAESIGLGPHPSLIRARLSNESFSNRKVDIGKLLRLLEAARWTPSYGNEQPWNFIVTSKDDPGAHARLLSRLAESNLSRARLAPILILSVVKLNFEMGSFQKGSVERASFERAGHRNPYAFHDAGKAVSNLAHKAGAMGLLVHQMSGFDAVRAREFFSIPSGYIPVAVIAIGYPEPDGPATNPAMDGADSRLPLESLVFAGRWGEASPLLAVATPDPCDERKM